MKAVKTKSMRVWHYTEENYKKGIPDWMDSRDFNFGEMLSAPYKSNYSVVAQFDPTTNLSFDKEFHLGDYILEDTVWQYMVVSEDIFKKEYEVIVYND